MRSWHSNAHWIIAPSVSFHSCLHITTVFSVILPLLIYNLCLKTRCLIIHTQQRCRSAWVCICPGAASSRLLYSISHSWFQRVWSPQRDERITCFTLPYDPCVFRSIKQAVQYKVVLLFLNRFADLNAYVRGDFASQPQSTCVKAQRKKLNRLETAGLCWSYSRALLRAESISQIMLWMTCSERVAHKSTGGLSTRYSKGKSCDLSSYFSFVTHSVRLHVLFLSFFFRIRLAVTVTAV